jgi:L-erythro-3,5-diaminohexanoate dehydrogenase
MLCLYEAKKKVGKNGKVICLGHSESSLDRVRSVDLADEYLMADATNPVEVLAAVEKATNGQMADVTINCVNIPDTEMSCILSTNPEGLIYFFSMATSFTKAALGAEGVGMDTTMIIGNGYAKNHAEISLNIMRESKDLRELYEKLYA